MRNELEKTQGNVQVSRRVFNNLISLFAPPGLSPNAVIQLKIKTDSQQVNIRELAAYLAFIDRVYGRLAYRNLGSYSHIREQQLVISEFRLGSLELLVTKLISEAHAPYIIILGLIVKYIPDIIRSLTENTKVRSEVKKNQAEIFKLTEEGLLTRENRKQLRNSFKQDEKLRQLDRNTLNALIAVMVAIYEREQNALPAIRRFTDEHVQSVETKVHVEEPNLQDRTKNLDL